MYPELAMKEMKEKILSDATKDHIKSNRGKTNNLLVYLACMNSKKRYILKK